MLKVANAIVFAGCFAIFLGLRWIAREYGWTAGVACSLAILAAVTVHQIRHYRRYGRWYEGVIRLAASPPETVGARAAIKDSAGEFGT